MKANQYYDHKVVRIGSKRHQEVTFASHNDVIKFVEDAAGSRLTARATPHRFSGVVLAQDGSYKRGFRITLTYFHIFYSIWDSLVRKMDFLTGRQEWRLRGPDPARGTRHHLPGGLKACNRDRKWNIDLEACNDQARPSEYWSRKQPRTLDTGPAGGPGERDSPCWRGELK